MTSTPGERPARPRNLPARIGRYEVTGRLGRGAMGVVYSARNAVIEREVAIKVMNAEVGTTRMSEPGSSEKPVSAGCSFIGTSPPCSTWARRTAVRSSSWNCCTGSP